MSGTAFIVGGFDVAIVTDRSGKTGIAAGVPINDFTVLSAAVAASLVTDSDAVYAPSIANLLQIVQPPAVADTDTLIQPAVTAIGLLLPGIISADDAFFSATVLRGSVSLAAPLFSDVDAIYASIIVVAPSQSLLPALFLESDTAYAPVVSAVAPVSQSLLPTRIVDADSFFVPSIVAAGAPRTLAPAFAANDDIIYPAFDISTAKLPKSQTLRAGRLNDADVIYAPRLSLVPLLVVDAEVIYATITQAVYPLRPALVASDDAFYSPRIANLVQPALVIDADAIYRPGITLFLVPQIVVDADTIPHADVGWKVFADITRDADQVFAPLAKAWNYIVPELLIEDDVIDTYPFFVHGVEGGVPVEKPPGILTGSVGSTRRLTGSVGRRVQLTGSFANKTRRVLTGSVRRK